MHVERHKEETKADIRSICREGQCVFTVCRVWRVWGLAAGQSWSRGVGWGRIGLVLHVDGLSTKALCVFVSSQNSPFFECYDLPGAVECPGLLSVCICVFEFMAKSYRWGAVTKCSCSMRYSVHVCVCVYDPVTKFMKNVSQIWKAQ